MLLFSNIAHVNINADYTPNLFYRFSVYCNINNAQINLKAHWVTVARTGCAALQQWVQYHVSETMWSSQSVDSNILGRRVLLPR